MGESVFDPDLMPDEIAEFLLWKKQRDAEDAARRERIEAIWPPKVEQR